VDSAGKYFCCRITSSLFYIVISLTHHSDNAGFCFVCMISLQTTVAGPPAEFCPAFVPETVVPSSVPSSAVSDVPSDSPSTGEKCICQPFGITFTLDFSIDCTERSIFTGDPGISEVGCLTSPMGVDLTPISVETVTIVEVDQNLDVIKMVNFTETLSSGDSINYESFAASNDFASGGIVPRAVTVILNGLNAAGDNITNSFVIVYTNDCNVYPALVDGDQIGWTTLVSVFAT
jgi:hypothetical protein